MSTAASRRTQFKKGTSKARSHGRKGGKKSRPPSSKAKKG